MVVSYVLASVLVFARRVGVRNGFAYVGVCGRFVFVFSRCLLSLHVPEHKQLNVEIGDLEKAADEAGDYIAAFTSHEEGEEGHEGDAEVKMLA